MMLLSFTSFACQFGGLLEATPTPRAADDDEEDEAPPEDEDEESATPTPAPDPDPVETGSVPIERLQQATVLILAQQVMNGRLQTVWTGSGTILTPEGVILTNAHVAAPTAPGLATLYNDPEMLFSDELDQIVISMIERADQLPEDRYIAELRAADGPLDLAVLEIVSDLEGNPVSGLDLPYVEIGDADDIRLGDEVRVLGYPGAGGETITFTRGNVSGFESQDFVGERAWIKTDSTISPGKLCRS
jgi:putative serine protease PepD